MKWPYKHNFHSIFIQNLLQFFFFQSTEINRIASTTLSYATTSGCCSHTRVFLSIVANIRPRAKSLIISWQCNKGFQQVSEKKTVVLAQWWDHLPYTNVTWVQFPDLLTLYTCGHVGWLWWLFSLLWEMFLVFFSASHQNQHLICFVVISFDLFQSPQLQECLLSLISLRLKHTDYYH